MPVTRLVASSRACILAALIMLPLTAGAAEFSDAEAKRYFNAKGCNACHGVDELRIGPPYRAVAMRYEATPEVTDRLAMKIMFGGSGAWGTVPMVSNPAVSPAEAQGLARWILNRRPRESRGD